MKKISILLTMVVFITAAACAQQDKSKRPSPPATATGKSASGATIKIDYSQPAVKGRTIGKDLEPMPGKVWRTGANEATVFEVDKDVSVEGKKLPAGKYGLFTINDGNEWTIIFNKTWKQWGAFDYKEADDVLRVKVTGAEASTPAERMTFTVENGKVTLMWGNKKVSFNVS